MAGNLPRIAVVGTGGTISSLGASSLDVLDYPDFGQKLTSEELLDRFPETRLVAEPAPVESAPVEPVASAEPEAPAPSAVADTANLAPAGAAEEPVVPEEPAVPEEPTPESPEPASSL